MQTSLYSLHTPVHRAVVRACRDALRLLFEQVRSQRDALRRQRQARTTHQALAALNDRQLHDLGIHRSELLSIAVQPCDPHRARVMWPS